MLRVWNFDGIPPTWRVFREACQAIMITIGLLGDVACGKSLVASLFAELGAGVIDGDAAGHEALRLDDVERAARQRWGDGIFGADGRIDRKRLAKIVFAPGAEGQTERTYLEQLTHPKIAQAIERQLRQFEAAGHPAAILDAAVLLDAGWDRFCEKFAFVDASIEDCRRRAQSRGWTDQQLAARQRAQAGVDEKRARADWIIDNSGPPEQTRAQVERIWRGLCG